MSEQNHWGALGDNPPAIPGVMGLPIGINGPAPDCHGDCVVGGDFNRQLSVITHTDPEHPAITVCIADRAAGTCLEIIIDGQNAIRMGRAFSSGGMWVYQAELALDAREREEE